METRQRIHFSSAIYYGAKQALELPTMPLNFVAMVLFGKSPPARISLCWANSLNESSQALLGYMFPTHTNTKHLPVAAGEGRG